MIEKTVFDYFYPEKRETLELATAVIKKETTIKQSVFINKIDDENVTISSPVPLDRIKNDFSFNYFSNEWINIKFNNVKTESLKSRYRGRNLYDLPINYVSEYEKKELEQKAREEVTYDKVNNDMARVAMQKEEFQKQFSLLRENKQKKLVNVLKKNAA